MVLPGPFQWGCPTQGRVCAMPPDAGSAFLVMLMASWRASSLAIEKYVLVWVRVRTFVSCWEHSRLIDDPYGTVLVQNKLSGLSIFKYAFFSFKSVFTRRVSISKYINICWKQPTTWNSNMLSDMLDNCWLEYFPDVLPIRTGLAAAAVLHSSEKASNKFDRSLRSHMTRFLGVSMVVLWKNICAGMRWIRRIFSALLSTYKDKVKTARTPQNRSKASVLLY